MARNLSAAQKLWLTRHLDGRREVRFDDVERALMAQTIDPVPSVQALSAALCANGWRKDRVVRKHGVKVFYVREDGI